MTRVLGLHHVGVNVDDLRKAIANAAAAGFRAGSILHLADKTAARGNGMEVIDMQVCFVGNGQVVVELLEHRQRRGDTSTGTLPGRGVMGGAQWLLPGASIAQLDLPGVIAAVHPAPVNLCWASIDVEATGAIFDCLGLVRIASTGAEHLCWELSEGTLRLVPADSDSPSARQADAVGRSHLALRVADARTAYDTLRDAGHSCVTPPIPHEDVLSWFFVRDQGGVALEIVQDNSVG